MSSCPGRAPQLSALVDGALDDRRREELLGHLLGCADCRTELAQLRALQQRVRPSHPEQPPAELLGRLARIAGEESGRPLYARPFDQHPGPRRLPSRRRRRRLQVTGVFASTCVLVSGAVAIGWFAAPATRTPALDPGHLARSELAAVLGDNTLASPAEVAARATERSGPRATRAEVPATATGPMSPQGAAELLRRASAASTLTTRTGRQLVQIRHLQGFWVATAELTARPGEGVRLHVTGSDHNQTTTWLAAPATDELELLGRTHQLRSGRGPVVAGHQSQVVEALSEGQVRSRWWVDETTGVLLWHQSLDAIGDTVVSVGWTELSSTDATQDPREPPARVTSPTTTSLAMTSLDPQRAPGLAGGGWSCDDHLAGLELVGIRHHRPEQAAAAEPAMVHSSYSDGVSTVGVLEQRGALAGAPEGFVWDPTLRAYRGLGMTTTLVWQSGDRVFTVSTDGPAALAERAVGELPHRSPVLRTRSERVLDGWKQLLGHRHG